ncbi:hypothetical protein CBM2637_B100171 [Cupriavidus taiwanensis]|nr:hypothetical protein CBM2637_B100171 [Cupriavidus taiwanensis]
MWEGGHDSAARGEIGGKAPLRHQVSDPEDSTHIAARRTECRMTDPPVRQLPCRGCRPAATSRLCN